MTPALPDTSAPPSEHRPEPTASRAVAIPLIVWLLLQLAAISLAASRLPLSANYPRPAQGLAVHGILIAQFAGSAVFLPVLFRGWRAWIVMVVTSGLMLVLASTMTAVPLKQVMILWGHVTAWITALAIWRAALPRRTDVLTAIAIFLTAGGLLLAYLHGEFQPAVETEWLKAFPLDSAMGPIADFTRFEPPFPSTSIGLIACGLVILAITRAKRRENDQLAVDVI